MINTLLLLGIILGFGFLVGRIAHNFKLTAIIGYITLGILLGPYFLNVLRLTPKTEHLLVNFTLGVIAFVIGLRLTIRLMKKLGKSIIFIIIGESFGAFFITTIGVYFLTNNLPLALLLGSLAPASAPAGTLAVIQEYRSRGPLTNTILAVVGLDDGLAVMIFVFILAIVKLIFGKSVSLINLLLMSLLEIGGSIILGILMGIILVPILKRVIDKEDVFITCLAGILICGGLAQIFNLSLILSCLTFGMTLINVFPRIERAGLNILEEILPSIYILFFVVAGSELKLNLLPYMGTLGLVYIFCRIVGLSGGAFLSSWISGVDKVIQKYLGVAILSQAGVAVGLAYLVDIHLSTFGMVGKEIGALVITTILSTTIIFELIGPLGVKYAITKAGESVV